MNKAIFFLFFILTGCVENNRTTTNDLLEETEIELEIVTANDINEDFSGTYRISGTCSENDKEVKVELRDSDR